MKYRLRKSRSGWIIEGESVHYVGGRLAEAWEELFEAFGLLERTWGSVLLVGMGASLLQILHRTAQVPPPHADIIEIDPEMVALQETYYALPIPYKVHVGEAAEQIHAIEGSYTGIFVDAFVEDSVPESLRTAQFVRKIGECLAEEGLLFWNTLKKTEAAEVGRLLKERFPEVRHWRYGAHLFWVASHTKAAFPLPG